MSRLANDGIRKGIAIHIGGTQGNRKRGIFRSRHRLVLGNWRIVHGGDGDGDGSDIAVNQAVIGLEGEAVLANIVKARSISSHAVNQSHSTVSRLANDGIRQLIVFNIACHEGDSHGGFFRSGIRYILRDRSVIHRIDCDGDSGFVGPQALGSRVGHQLINESVGAGEVGIRNVDERAITLE